jgi:hypothetical protein
VRGRGRPRLAWAKRCSSAAFVTADLPSIAPKAVAFFPFNPASRRPLKRTRNPKPCCFSRERLPVQEFCFSPGGPLTNRSYSERFCEARAEMSLRDSHFYQSPARPVAQFILVAFADLANSEEGIGNLETSEAMTVLEILRIEEIALRLNSSRDNQ